jgi:hydroxypyruvate isomerase
MPRFSENLRYLFQEYPLYDRFSAAAYMGFKAVEYQFPFGEDVSKLQTVLDKHGLEIVLINAPPGNYAAGDSDLAGIVEREAEFKETIEDAIFYSTTLNCPRIHIIAGVLKAHFAHEVALSVLSENLKYAVDLCAEAGIKVLTEPLNTIDVPWYLIGHTIQARTLMVIVNSENLFLQYDLYHCGMNGENLEDSIKSNLNVIDYIQVAGGPGRAEPDIGDIDFKKSLKFGYDWISSMGGV